LEYPVNKLTAQELPIAPPLDAGPVGRIIYLHVLCGMLTEHLDAYDAASKLEARSGVGIVLPSELIWQALLTPAPRTERHKRDIETLTS
jgi:hypothetical protein